MSWFPPDTTHTTSVSSLSGIETWRSAAVASAPAGSAITPSVWKSSIISSQSMPGSTPQTSNGPG